MNKYLLGFLVVVIAGVAWLGVTLPAAPKPPLGSSAGSTFNTAKLAAIRWTMSNGATTTSLYNGDASDRYVQFLNFACTGVGTSKTAFTGAGLASVSLRAATTSTNAPANVRNTNYIVNHTFATSSAFYNVASSTMQWGAVSQRNLVWPTGTYLSFWSTATNTAACTMGVSYLGG